MSGDHRTTTSYKKELLVNNGFSQLTNTSLFKGKKIYILSPAIAINTNGEYWFDIREAILDKISPKNEINSSYIIIRIIPLIFIVAPLRDILETIKEYSKTEKTGKKVWSLEVTNNFTNITNKTNTSETISVKKMNESELNAFLKTSNN